jgi:hypothetical protein
VRQSAAPETRPRSEIGQPNSPQVAKAATAPAEFGVPTVSGVRAETESAIGVNVREALTALLGTHNSADQFHRRCAGTAQVDPRGNHV